MRTYSFKVTLYIHEIKDSPSKKINKICLKYL
jgi:hypothetical protein